VYYVCIGIDAIINNINRTPLEGTILMATRSPVVTKETPSQGTILAVTKPLVITKKPKPPVITNDIKISNLLASKCSLKVLHKYFSNKKKSGINAYKGIEIIDKTTAILQLHDEKGRYEFCYQYDNFILHM